MRVLAPVGLLVQVLVGAGIVVVVCLVLFLTGVVRPGRSRKLQDGVDRASAKAEEKSDQGAGLFGDATESSLRAARRTADKSAEAGREAHNKLNS
ncbi:MAG TPA: hypothetical protein VHI54_11205 [Actinomycetota bacterium]|nr:hypothetical protein [Actinomycetota bacterium]